MSETIPERPTTQIFDAHNECDAETRATVLQRQHPDARVFIRVEFPLGGKRRFRVIVTYDEQVFRVTPG